MTTHRATAAPLAAEITPTSPPRAGARCIAVLGAESTGKTTLAQGLALALSQLQGTPAGGASTAHAPLRAAWVPEVLRQWCDQRGRTPLAHEQAAILEEQHARIDAAVRSHDVVVCDTTGLMTAVYSALIFGDHSLEALALQLHSRMHLSLLTALDLPWVADGHQRDGPQVRGPVDSAIRALMLGNALPFAVVGGTGPARLQQALAAVVPLLRPAGPPTSPDSGPSDGTGTGMFSRLQTVADHSPRWLCECCGDAPYERALRRAAAS